MNNFLISFILAAGVGALAYSKLGRRMGYGSSARVWKMVIGTFIVSFFVFITLLTFVIHFHGVTPPTSS